MDEEKTLQALSWAMAELERIGPPNKAHEGSCHPDAGCDGMCVDYAYYMEGYWKARNILEKSGKWPMLISR